MSYLMKVERSIFIEIYDCASCGAPVALTNDHERRARQTGETFFCARGHAQSFNASENDKLRSKLDAQIRESTTQAERARLAIERAQRAEAAEQAATTEMKRLKKRASAGVCPCCNRTFQSLARHMQTKHPEYK